MPGSTFDFSDAFEGLTAHPPFPWQRRLFQDWLSRGALPDAVEIPSGLGKTAVMAVWLLARATGAPLPRRLVHVVDRRGVLDPASELAEEIRERLRRRPELAPVRHGLRLGDRDLPISTARGRFAGDREWMLDPSAPAIVVGTVETVGSQLLFEGHGLSRRVRPRAAGMLGCDSLVLLDDADLSHPFERLLRSIEAGRRRSAGNGSAAAEGAFAGPMARGPVPPPLRMLPMRAPSGHGAEPGICGLSADDRRHGIVRARLDAEKRLTVEDLEPGSTLDEVMAERARDLMHDEISTGGGCARIAIYCDRRRVAEAVADRLRKRSTKESLETEVILLAGEERMRERGLAGDRLEAHGLIAGGDAVREVPVFLVATSAGEVAIDLEADHMVCEMVAWDRMVRRLGRVNRRGSKTARVLTIDQGLRGGPKARAESSRRNAARALLEALPGDPDGGRHADPESIAGLGADPGLRTLIGDATARPPLYPALTRPVAGADEPGPKGGAAGTARRPRRTRVSLIRRRAARPSRDRQHRSRGRRAVRGAPVTGPPAPAPGPGSAGRADSSGPRR